MNIISEWLDKISQLNIVAAPFAVVLIIVGLAVCFFGRRLLKPALAVCGFAGGVILGNYLVHLINTEQLAKEYVNNDLVRMIPIVTGIILAALCVGFVSIAMYLLAAAGGLVSFAIVKDAIEGSLGIEVSKGVKTGILLCALIVPIVLVIFIQDYVVSVTMAVIGAAILMVGVDNLAKKGFLDSLRRFWDFGKHLDQQRVQSHINGIKVNKELLLMYAGFLTVAIVGSIFQIHSIQKK